MNIFNKDTVPTLESVLASFQKTIEDLDQVAHVEMEKSERKRGEANRLLNEADNHGETSIRAAAVRNKISALVS